MVIVYGEKGGMKKGGERGGEEIKKNEWEQNLERENNLK